MSLVRQSDIFFGWRVVGAAFVLAVLGWGTGFYGPPIYWQAIQETKGWPVPLISTAVTVHFVIGAVVVANLPTLYMRFGIPNATKASALFLAIVSSAGPTRRRLGSSSRPHCSAERAGRRWAGLQSTRSLPRGLCAPGPPHSPWLITGRASEGSFSRRSGWLASASCSDRRCHGAYDVGSCRLAPLADASADGIAARQ